MPDKLSDSAPATKSSATDASGLAEALRKQLRGGLPGEVRFDDGCPRPLRDRRFQLPPGPDRRSSPPRHRRRPRHLALCREFGAPLLCRGGGTSLAGQCCNVAVVLDFSKYMARILEIDPARRIARVQPGVVLDNLRNAAEKHHLTFAPDPASHDRCTLGGMIGNNSCGVHSVMAGKTDDNIEHLEVVTYDGVRMKRWSELHPGRCGDGRPRPPAARVHRAAATRTAPSTSTPP